MGFSQVGNGGVDIVTASRTITANSQTLELNVSSVSTVTVSLYDTCSGVNLTFEGSSNGGTSWVALMAVPINSVTTTASTTSGSQTLGAGNSYVGLVAVHNYPLFRVRVTSWTSGNPTLTIYGKTFGQDSRIINPVVANIGSLPATSATHVNSAASTNATAVKTSAGSIYNVVAFNSGAAAAYIKFYNKASAPTVGTDVPVMVLAVPVNGTAQITAGGWGHRFATGIGMAITGGAANSDTTAVAASQVQVSVAYI